MSGMTTERLLALSLRAVAVQARHAESCMGNLTGDLICAMFRTCEDQYRFGGSLFEQLEQQRGL